MAYTRDGVPANKPVLLQAVFFDATGEPKDVDNIAAIEIATYRPDDDSEVEDWEDEIAAGYPNAFERLSLDDAANDNFTAIAKVATGFYEITYTPTDADLNADGELDNIGNWTDLWVATVDGVEIYAAFSFSVKEKGRIVQQIIKNNTLIVIVLSEDIAGAGGNLLGEEIQLSYSTEYNPYYASVDLVRLECGSWLDSIPDDTISLMIHWSSIEADTIKPNSWNGNVLDTARVKFVVYDVALRCLQLPADIGGKKKSLGDLLIETTSDFSSVLSEIRKQRNQWERVINAGGTIVPGQSLTPSTAARGAGTRDLTGRLWHDPAVVHFGQPSQNSKFSIDGIKKRYGWKKR